MRIKKISETTPTMASVVNQTNSSTEDSYSCNYANEHYEGKILWTNPNPTSSMAGNTEINLSSSDYDVLEVFYKVRHINEPVSSTKTLKGYSIGLCGGGYYADGIATYTRTIGRTDDTHFNSGEAFGVNKSSDFTNNDMLIPIYIVGYKTNIFN
jgi:hypothetical protein